jgi:hypothetical protein
MLPDLSKQGFLCGEPGGKDVLGAPPVGTYLVGT